MPILEPLIRPRDCIFGALPIRCSIHYTRAPRAPANLDALPENLSVHPGRPDLLRTLEGTVDAVIAEHKGAQDRPMGVVVGTCGPIELGDDSSRAAGKLDWERWKAVRGVETYEE